MAIFLGAKGDDILAWRNVAELVTGLQASIAEKQRSISAAEGVSLLADLRQRIAAELAYEEFYNTRIAELVAECAAVETEEALQNVVQKCRDMSAEYFQQRGSVVAYHALCNLFQELLFARVLWLAEEWMARHGFGRAPVPHCWFAVGSAGRQEGTLCRDFDSLLVHDDGNKEAAAFFIGFSSRVVAMLENIGLRSRSGIAPVNPTWRGSRKEWRSRLTEGFSGKGADGINNVLPLADMRLLYGDQQLADEMKNLVASILDHHQEKLRELAVNISVLPVGLDFFGRLRVERSGPHKGRFNLELYALIPLVANARVMALKYGIAATSTLDRLKQLMERGPLSIDLTERLLRAYHEFARCRISAGLRYWQEQELESFIDPDEQSENEQHDLKVALEALLNLQKLVYLDFVEHG